MRNREIYDLWVSGKSLQAIATRFGISRSRAHQIVAKQRQTMKAEREMRASPDPLLRALGNGLISRKVYNNLVRGGYGKTFDFADLLFRLRSGTFDPKIFRDLGAKSVSQLRRAFLSQDVINPVNELESRPDRANGDTAISTGSRP